jgi:phage terminase large subunit-like protein
MGRRGPGARPVAKAEKRTSDIPETHAWQAPNLSRADRVIAFIESLPVTKGILAGKTMKLIPEQAAFIREIYDPADADGRRIVRQAVLSEARKNGKTGLIVGIVCAHLVGPEAEDRGEVVSAANDREQSGIIFSEIEAIVDAVPWIAAIVNVMRFRKEIEVTGTPPDGKGKGSTFKALSSDATTKHGLNPSLWIFDELAQAKKRDLLDALQTSQGGRSEPLGIVISTQSPKPTHPLSELIDYGEKIDEGIIEDATFVCHVYAAPDGCDLLDEDAWRAANPALGIFRDLTDLRTLALRATRVPSFENPFRNLYLNQRVDAEQKAIDPAEWNACGEAFDIEELRGQRCYAGLDLASVRDLASAVLLFPDCGAVLPFFWCPKEGIDKKAEVDRVPYPTWAKQGYIEPTPGKAINKRYIARRFAQIAADYDLEAVAFDRWAINDLKVILADEGIDLPLVEWGQGHVSMGPAVDAFETRMLAGNLRHGMHPVLRWCASNLIYATDSAGARKPDKSRSIDRIDGMTALIMACGVEASGKGEEKPKKYEILAVHR